MPEFPRSDFRLHVGWRNIKTSITAMLVAIVYCLIGRVASFKPVSIVYQGSDYCLVKPGKIEAATESQQSLYTLRPNDEVIVSAGELYNGKVVD